jgi:4-amino-4-deoxy-L-arabinose transferase-like glycosyltransferase
VRRLRASTDGWLKSIPAGERRLVATAMGLSLLIVVVYVLATRPDRLAGDQAEYNQMGTFFTQGHWWWSTHPFGIAHASAWRPPVYPLWVGFWYWLLGVGVTKVLLIQSVLAALTVALTWALARRLFGPRTAIASAFVVAIFPLSWEWFGLLYTEAFAIPLTLLVLLIFLERPPTRNTAIATGIAMGVLLMVRPTSVFMFAGVLVAWGVAYDLRRAARFTALSIIAAVLVITPWAIRNSIVAHGFVPLSMQDSAIYGTFSSTAAGDPRFPYAWRAYAPGARRILDNSSLTDAEVHSKLITLGLDYIKDHPASLLEAFYWNGLSRLWDIRRPSNALAEVPFEGRSRSLDKIGLGMYYVLVPLAVFGLWKARSRRALVLGLLAMALAASVVFTAASGTRYRAPLEPLIAILAMSALFAPASAREPAPRPSP